MKLAQDWIQEHGQSGEYPKVDEPVGCFTEAQVREIQGDAANSDHLQIAELWADISMDRALAKAKEGK